MWFPYIQILPQTYDTLWQWENNELEALENEELSEIAKNAYQKYEQTFVTVREATKHVFQPPLSWEEFTWAISVVHTRSCYLEVKDKSSKNENVALVPLLDLLNHSCNANSRVLWDEHESYSVFTTAELQDGKEAFISYGDHGNGSLLEYYGFAVLDNPKERLEIRFLDIEEMLHKNCPIVSEIQEMPRTYIPKLAERKSHSIRPQESVHVSARAMASRLREQKIAKAQEYDQHANTNSLLCRRCVAFCHPDIAQAEKELLYCCGLYLLVDIDSQSSYRFMVMNSGEDPWELFSYLKIRCIISWMAAHKEESGRTNGNKTKASTRRGHIDTCLDSYVQCILSGDVLFPEKLQDMFSFLKGSLSEYLLQRFPTTLSQDEEQSERAHSMDYRQAMALNYRLTTKRMINDVFHEKSI